jgi:tRNA pseudouridine13 synthase
MTLDSLRVPDAPQIHFDAEERPLFSYPGKLLVGEAKPDELNKGKLRVNVAFTLPPGAYATLVLKRLFWWTLQPGRARAAVEAKPPRPTAEQIHERRKQTGFLAKKRARKAARAGAAKKS